MDVDATPAKAQPPAPLVGLAAAGSAPPVTGQPAAQPLVGLAAPAPAAAPLVGLAVAPSAPPVQPTAPAAPIAPLVGLATANGAPPAPHAVQPPAQPLVGLAAAPLVGLAATGGASVAASTPTLPAQPLVGLAAAPLVGLAAPEAAAGALAVPSSLVAMAAERPRRPLVLPVLYKSSDGAAVLRYTALQDALTAPRQPSLKKAFESKRHRKAARQARALARTARDESTQRAEESAEESGDDVPALLGGVVGAARRRRERREGGEGDAKDSNDDADAADKHVRSLRLGRRPEAVRVAEALARAVPRRASSRAVQAALAAAPAAGAADEAAMDAQFSLLTQCCWEDDIAWGSSDDGGDRVAATGRADGSLIEFDTDEEDDAAALLGGAAAGGDGGGSALDAAPAAAGGGGAPAQQGSGAWDAAMDERPDGVPAAAAKQQQPGRRAPQVLVVVEKLDSRGHGRGRMSPRQDGVADNSYDADDDGEMDDVTIQAEMQLRKLLAGEGPGSKTYWEEIEGGSAAIRLTGSSEPFRHNAHLRRADWLDGVLERAMEGEAAADVRCLPDMNDPWLSFEASKGIDIADAKLGGATVVPAPAEPANKALLAADPPDEVFNISQDSAYAAKKRKDRSSALSGKGSKVAHALPALKLATVPLVFGTKEQMLELELQHRPRAQWDARAASEAARAPRASSTKPSEARVIIQSLGGRRARAPCDLGAPASALVASLLESSSWKAHVPPADKEPPADTAPPLRLFYRGAELDPSLSLGAQGVADGSVLTLSATQLRLLCECPMPDEDKPVCPPAAFQKEKHLGVENGKVVLFEYSEEIPLMLSERGMGARYNAWYRRRGGTDVPSMRQYKDAGSLASWQFLEQGEDSPFVADAHPGHVVCSMETALARAPAAGSAPLETDFLLCRHADGRLSLREINRVHAVGQQEPKLDVMRPQSKQVTEYEEKRLLATIYREFRRLLKADKKPGPAVVPPGAERPRLRATDVYRDFRPLKEEHIRRRLRHCADLIRDGGKVLIVARVCGAVCQERVTPPQLFLRRLRRRAPLAPARAPTHVHRAPCARSPRARSGGILCYDRGRCFSSSRRASWCPPRWRYGASARLRWRASTRRCWRRRPGWRRWASTRPRARCPSACVTPWARCPRTARLAAWAWASLRRCSWRRGTSQTTS